MSLNIFFNQNITCFKFTKQRIFYKKRRYIIYAVNIYYVSQHIHSVPDYKTNSDRFDPIKKESYSTNNFDKVGLEDSRGAES